MYFSRFNKDVGRNLGECYVLLVGCMIRGEKVVNLEFWEVCVRYGGMLLGMEDYLVTDIFAVLVSISKITELTDT